MSSNKEKNIRSAHRAMAIAMQARHGNGPRFMHDRRAPRGGSFNEERELLNEYETYTSGSIEEMNSEVQGE